MTPEERAQQLGCSIEQWNRCPEADRERVLAVLYDVSDKLKQRPERRGFTAFDAAFSILVYSGPPKKGG